MELSGNPFRTLALHLCNIPTGKKDFSYAIFLKFMMSKVDSGIEFRNPENQVGILQDSEVT